LNGLIVVFVVGSENIRHRLLRGREVASIEAEQPMAEAMIVDSKTEGKSHE
jgi:hypothetical protein